MMLEPDSRLWPSLVGGKYVMLSRALVLGLPLRASMPSPRS